MSAAIRARDVFLLYRAAHGDVAALRGLTLEVAQDETVAVLGPSGAGKSSLLGLCAGLRRPSSGELNVLGVDVGAAPSRRLASLRSRHIGIVRQHYHRALPPELTAEEIVALPLRLLGSWGTDERRRVAGLLRVAGLEGRKAAKPYELSGGEQQRLAVCAAVGKRPRLILADEPTGELDRAASERVIALLAELAAETGAAALVVTHDPAVARSARRTIHVRDGRLSGEGGADPVLVVDEHGWLRLPRRLRERAGVRERLRANASWGRIELLAVDPAEAHAPGEPLRPAPARQAGATVAVRELVKSFGAGATARTVVGGLSWRFEPGRLHVISGPSGSGKTTLLDLVAGLERPDQGEVWVDGRRIDLLGRGELARWRGLGVGYLSQHSTLIEYATARENVELALAVRGSGADARSIAEDALAAVGLADLADRRADRLSGGEQRRVALARALAGAPGLLVADEPTAHLDRVSGRRVIRLLREAVHDRGITVIAATHDPDLAAAADVELALGREAAAPTSSETA
jgi:ABC-type lipoprotein export system ATPase subunit